MSKGKKHSGDRRVQARSGRAAGFYSKPEIAVPFLLVATVIAAYANSLIAPFIFDDQVSILANPGIRRLWPLWPALWAPPQMPISGRPVVALSFALNYTFGEYQVWGYHAFNLIVHIFNAFLIFAVARCALAHARQGEGGKTGAGWLAGAAVLVWAVHPLLSESVTYIMQRTELLMAFFLLLTLYSVGRSAESPGWAWPLTAILSSALGMGCKEVMAAAPLLALLYDRIFLSSSYAELFRLRWRLYTGLFSTWAILAALLATGPRTLSVGLGFKSVGPREYLFTQAGVILHYLSLAIFPYPLCIDYSDWPVARSLASALPEGLVIVALLALTGWAIKNRPRLGFLGAGFFLILAPSSSLIPIVTEPAAERRMYLPLFPVIFLLVAGAHKLAGLFLRESRLRRAQTALLAAVVIACVVFTAARNEDYRTELSIWTDTVARRPQNPRACNNLGSALAKEGRSGEAKPLFVRALELNPTYPEAQNNLGGALYSQGRMEEALEHFAEAVRLKPDYAAAHLNLGLTLHNRGRLDQAIGQYLEALRLNPADAEAHNHLGAALLSRGRPQEAIGHFREALRLRPGYIEAQRNLENARAR
jgi:tetratricopeptide (TPR) repeat protein